MKTYIILFLAAVGLMGTASCKKTYACSCYNATTGNYFTVNVEAKNVTDATTLCVQQTANGTATCNF